MITPREIEKNTQKTVIFDFGFAEKRQVIAIVLVWA